MLIFPSLPQWHLCGPLRKGSLLPPFCCQTSRLPPVPERHPTDGCSPWRLPAVFPLLTYPADAEHHPSGRPGCWSWHRRNKVPPNAHPVSAYPIHWSPQSFDKLPEKSSNLQKKPPPQWGIATWYHDPCEPGPQSQKPPQTRP